MEYGYLKENLDELKTDIINVCKNAGRDYNSVKLVAVSKTFSPEIINEVYNLGLEDFGENKVQELKDKQTALSGLPLKWHLVGHLQTNKVKYIADFVSLIHSVDSFKLALEIQRYAELKDRMIDILVQVNTSGEDQKSGLQSDDTARVCAEISTLDRLRLKGLMTIGMFTNDEDEIRSNFRLLRNLFEDLKQKHNSFEHLSMGMTSDYRIAVEEGATILRIGSAIFGRRVPPSRQ
jgi:hypothetical protein